MGRLVLLLYANEISKKRASRRASGQIAPFSFISTL
jgi:hypothetical protein